MFTDSDNFNGLMYLDLNPNYDKVIPEPATLVLLACGTLALTAFRRGIYR